MTMMHVFKRAWAGMLRPLIQRPNRVQVAALCTRTGDNGQEVLLITSQNNGRWILPKGWPMDGYDGAGTALQEAWEEAGVKTANVHSDPLGVYEYTKVMGEAGTVPVTTQVYLAEVTDLSEDYPDAATRKREWVSPSEAANRLDDPDLKAMLLAL